MTRSSDFINKAYDKYYANKKKYKGKYNGRTIKQEVAEEPEASEVCRTGKECSAPVA